MYKKALYTEAPRKEALYTITLHTALHAEALHMALYMALCTEAYHTVAL